MKDKVKRVISLIKSDLVLSARVAAVATALAIFLFSTLHFNLKAYTYENYQFERSDIITIKQSTLDYVSKPDPKLAEAAQEKKDAEIAIRLAEEKARKARAEKVDRVVAFLQRWNSPVANYTIADKIVAHSDANGADYRVVVAIMGIESGFCNAHFSFNCFGYLNGAKYSSFEHAFDDLVPKVARQYAAVYGWNFEALAKAYGMVNWQYHSANMRIYANSI